MWTDSGSFYGLWNDREMVETFFDEETNDAVGVEEEVAPGSIFVSDDSIESL